MYDLIIIGGGAAGMAAAVYALGKQLNFVVIYEDLGGKSSWGQHLSGQEEKEIRTGSEIVASFVRQVTAHPERTMYDCVTGVTKVGNLFHLETNQHGTLQSQAVIVATGATPMLLDVPGADDLTGRGLGYSMTSHAPLVAGKNIAVIGVTERTLRGVAEIARSATQIYLIAPESDGWVRTPLARSIRQYANVEILKGYTVKELVGPLHVEEIFLEREGQPRWISVDAAFADLGLRANSNMVKGILETDAQGFIRIDDRNATSLAGLFAAGDVTTAFGEQVLIAIGEGARAALSAYDYLLAKATGDMVDEESPQD